MNKSEAELSLSLATNDYKRPFMVLVLIIIIKMNNSIFFNEDGTIFFIKLLPHHIDYLFRKYHLFKELREDFVSKNDINIDNLNEYLKNSQKNKKYMLYKEKSLYFEEHNEYDYLIKSYEKEPSLSRYKAKTESGNTLKILIRWKNGNGVAFPAFQIS